MNTNRTGWTVACACALLALGCESTRSAESVGPARATQSLVQPGSDIDPVLYARDGSVVPLAARPSDRAAGVDGTPIHGLQPREESRMHLLDLYQSVVGEKEALALEVRSLDATLVELKHAAVVLESERDLLRTRVESLESEKRTLEEERNDLAARLTTAQIRRLEAEKLLLETRLASARAREKLDAVKRDKGGKSTREAASAKPAGAMTEAAHAAEPASGSAHATAAPGAKP